MNNEINIVPELLVPAGPCTKTVSTKINAISTILNSGSNSFSARASAKNFSLEEVAEVVKYCKLRNVKTNLTLNTLITDDEFADAIKVAESAYKCGVDAIIVGPWS